MALEARFLNAYLATLEEMAQGQYFTQVAPELCPDGHPFYWDPQGMNQALTARTGLTGWPLDLKLEYTEADLTDYIEGIYLIVSRPIKSWSHPFCGESHPTEFDVTAGRYDYTVAVNILFRKMAPGYSMEYGRVRVLGSSILDARLIEDLKFGGDEHLKKLITMAILDYRSTRIDDKWKGVRSLADAYERIKSDQGQSNKKQAISDLLDLMEGEFDLSEPLNAILGIATAISNTSTIRHHEVGKTEITDDRDLLDFLFHMYFNIIKFALQRRNHEREVR
ncbi:MAG TPA: hypothetical protein VMW30_05795 [Candidatus Paceibacterota bacterium]|nr:hypothetical protein [Candidatus Paceibacterota bacterium]